MVQKNQYLIFFSSPVADLEEGFDKQLLLCGNRETIDGCTRYYHDFLFLFFIFTMRSAPLIPPLGQAGGVGFGVGDAITLHRTPGH